MISETRKQIKIRQANIYKNKILSTIFLVGFFILVSLMLKETLAFIYITIIFSLLCLFGIGYGKWKMNKEAEEIQELLKQEKI